ncbi:hypothetical protein H5410_003939 [Solanum commersonii]|uniref:Retrotransposon gag domain-containing protein n=1 Tax=Solanum commersonii TaxID=4109 RepID=A0A9J6B684_SOLCO|nr:hypothetical protein H5410_003939 [Solanum commersonii]
MHPIEPTNSFNNDDDSIGNEKLGDHSKENLGDHSNESLGDHSMNIHDHSMNVENQSREQELRSQSNHSFSEGTNLCINQTFNNKNELLLLLAEAAKKSFDFSTLRSCTKYLKNLDENLHVNHHCEDYLYLYYNAAKAHSLEEFNNHFIEFKNKCLAVAIHEYDIDFEKWSRAHFPGNRYDVMTTNIAESLNESMSVHEYSLKFTKLSRYAPEMVADMRSRISLFVVGLPHLSSKKAT